MSLDARVPLAVLLAVCVAGCSASSEPGSGASPSARRLPAAVRSALGGAGQVRFAPGVAGSGQFDAPNVDPASWSGSPVGTGSFTVQLQPPLSGGPHSVAYLDSSSGRTWHVLVLGDLQASSGTGFYVARDQAFSLGALPIDGMHLFAGAFDLASGDAVAEADSGTLTLSVASATLGGRVTGSLQGTFQPISSQCTSSAQCPAGHQCQGGVCVAAGCTSNSQCPSGQVCQGGTCVTAGCTSNSQCPSGQVCQSGRCVSGGSGCLGKQGTAAFSVNLGQNATCSALGTLSFSVASGMGFVDSQGGTSPSVVLVDPVAPDRALLLELSACPGSTGTLSVGGAVSAKLYTQHQGAGLTLMAEHTATGGTVTFTQVGAVLAGSAALTFSGGSGTASFTLY